MRVLMKPIQMIAWFTEDGIPRPVRFRMLESDGTYMVIKVSKVTEQKEEKLAGNRMLVFTCQSTVDGVEKLYELKYELNTCKWYLYKL